MAEQDRYILVSNGEESVRRFYRETLEGVGYKVDEARTWKEGFRLMNRREYELVLTSIRLEGEDEGGIDLMVSAELLMPEQKILVIENGLTDEQIKEVEDEPNVVGWIEGPVNDPKKLLDLVRKSIEYPIQESG